MSIARLFLFLLAVLCSSLASAASCTFSYSAPYTVYNSVTHGSTSGSTSGSVTLDVSTLDGVCLGIVSGPFDHAGGTCSGVSGSFASGSGFHPWIVGDDEYSFSIAWTSSGCAEPSSDGLTMGSGVRELALQEVVLYVGCFLCFAVGFAARW